VSRSRLSTGGHGFDGGGVPIPVEPHPRPDPSGPRLASTDPSVTLHRGDALHVLRRMPPGTIDACITSPPYWRHREYENGGLGQEGTFRDYVGALVAILGEVCRVLKPSGSLWLNLGDTYRDKGMTGIPWRVALTLIDDHGWILRNDVIWHKIKGGPDSTRDRLRNLHEHVFHLVRERSYHYDVDAIRAAPRPAVVAGKLVTSASGVTGSRYRRQIETSTALTPEEKLAALTALRRTLEEVRAGRLSDFRMVLRGEQRVTHSDRLPVSGRARELADRGFYVLRYHPDGAKPGDVWSIVPESTQGRSGHFAPFPEALCRIPILATCPPGGTVLDPFCGTGTTLLAARHLGRSAVGIEISSTYLRMARARLGVPAGS